MNAIQTRRYKFPGELALSNSVLWIGFERARLQAALQRRLHQLLVLDHETGKADDEHQTGVRVVVDALPGQ